MGRGPLFGPLGSALGFGAGRVAGRIARAIGRLGPPRRVIVVGDDLARALARAGLPVVSVADRPRAHKKGPPQVRAALEALPFPEGCADAVVAEGLSMDAPVALRSLSRLLRDGGLLAVATRASALSRRTPSPEQLAAALVHAGLVDIEQQAVGGALVTQGRGRRWVATVAG